MAGKVIVITGANGGLGRALSRRFASDGESVVMLGRNPEKITAAAADVGMGAWAVQCEIGNPDSVRTAFATIAERHPTIDVLINNAGYFQPFILSEATDQQIMDGINGNLLGAILCSRSAIPMMPKGGKIIHVTSESVTWNYAMLTIYTAGKTGLERFSRALQEELWDEKTGIRSIIFRAGQMYGDGISGAMDEAIIGKFMAANERRGIRPPDRGYSSYDTVAKMMRSVVDMPDDVTIDVIACASVHAGN